MNHIKLNKCPSTQDYLKHLVEKFPDALKKDVLVTSLEQTKGRGRSANRWKSFENSIAMSFLIEAQEKKTLTPLYIGVMISKYLSSRYNKKLFLKWPNDILNEKREKVGGVICQLIEDRVIIGLGLNQVVEQKSPELPFAAGIFDLTENIEDPHQFASQFYKYLIDQNQEKISTISEWNSLCLHLNEEVKIDNLQGIFTGISEYGEAILKTKNGQKKIISGSLFFVP